MICKGRRVLIIEYLECIVEGVCSAYLRLIFGCLRGERLEVRGERLEVRGER